MKDKQRQTYSRLLETVCGTTVLRQRNTGVIQQYIQAILVLLELVDKVVDRGKDG